MGAWGVGSFENDTACDWLFELQKFKNLGLIEQAIGRSNTQEYIDANVATEALAACEILAALLGKEGTLPDEAQQWVQANPQTVPPFLVEQAQLALRRIEGDQSELQELWAETEDLRPWKATLTDLFSRLGGSVA